MTGVAGRYAGWGEEFTEDLKGGAYRGAVKALSGWVGRAVSYGGEGSDSSLRAT